jgi:hypothetical protein
VKHHTRVYSSTQKFNLVLLAIKDIKDERTVVVKWGILVTGEEVLRSVGEGDQRRSARRGVRCVVACIRWIRVK